MEMSNEIGSRVRYGEAFWRAHHEAWQQSALNAASGSQLATAVSAAKYGSLGRPGRRRAAALMLKIEPDVLAGQMRRQTL